MDNKPAPLLHFKTSPALRKRVEKCAPRLDLRLNLEPRFEPTSPWRRWELVTATAAGGRSHSWLVRCLTHEEDYEHVFIDQNEALDRFIGRGSVPVISRRPSPPQRAKSHGTLPGADLLALLPESLGDGVGRETCSSGEASYRPPAPPPSGGLWQPSTSARRSA